MTTAYPLTWPPNIPRSPRRERGKFKTSLAAALKNVEGSLKLFARDSGKALHDVTISSNVTLGRDNPGDPGVAVWFTWDGLQVAIPIDRYQSVAANLQAVHHILEARRVELRHGTLALVRATFTGFKALPPPPGAASWRDVLGLQHVAKVTRDDIEKAYRTKAKRCHPDAGGSAEQMTQLNEAKAAALAAIGD